MLECSRVRVLECSNRSGTRRSSFRLQASDYRLQTSDLNLQASDFKLQVSGDGDGKTGGFEMAYVRAKGNQVVIVHGERDPESKKVQQKTLFTIYSKSEARAAIDERASWFKRNLEDEFPQIRFNWKKLRVGIEENMEVLPDAYEHKKERVDRRFHEALVDFTRELLVADPRAHMSSARVLQEHREQLEFLREMIDWRLENSDREPNQWNQDDPFYWTRLMSRRTVPADVRENLAGLFNNGEYDRVKEISKLVTECWDNFPEGYLSLGTIAHRSGELEEALGWFEKAKNVGRKLFPKRIKKERYWGDSSTRPYIRALIYLAQTYNRIGDYEAALSYCDKLEKECHQDVFAESERTPVYMNSGEFQKAVLAAKKVCSIYPEENLPLAFALYETGEEKQARIHFLTGALRFPRATFMFCGYPSMSEPETFFEAQDHNKGVGFLDSLEEYLSKRGSEATRFFRGILDNPRVTELVDEVEDLQRKWGKSSPPDREWFERLQEMQSEEFAVSKASEIWPES